MEFPVSCLRTPKLLSSLLKTLQQPPAAPTSRATALGMSLLAVHQARGVQRALVQCEGSVCFCTARAAAGPARPAAGHGSLREAKGEHPPQKVLRTLLWEQDPASFVGASKPIMGISSYR